MTHDDDRRVEAELRAAGITDAEVPSVAASVRVLAAAGEEEP